jgi:hypothetical protein
MGSRTANKQPVTANVTAVLTHSDCKIAKISAADRRRLADISLQITPKTASAACDEPVRAATRREGSLMEPSLDTADWNSYCETMKNLTVSLDDETYRRARMIAAQRDTSVSAMVKRFLLDLASGESETERLKRQEQELRERITDFDASDRLSRDDVHRRDA